MAGSLQALLLLGGLRQHLKEYTIQMRGNHSLDQYGGYPLGENLQVFLTALTAPSSQYHEPSFDLGNRWTRVLAKRLGYDCLLVAQQVNS